MEMIIEPLTETIAVMRITGDINASNFIQVVDKAREIYNNPITDLIIDLSGVPSISSAGVVAIHKVALLFSGSSQDVEEHENPDFTHVSSARKHVRLLNPQPAVDKTLASSGMRLFFKMYTNIEDAIQSL